MAMTHVVIVFRCDVTSSKMFAVAEMIFKRLPTRICYQMYQKLDPVKSEEIARTIRFCFQYPEATFSFMSARDADFAEEFIEEHRENNRDARAVIERIRLA